MTNLKKFTSVSKTSLKLLLIILSFLVLLLTFTTIYLLGQPLLIAEESSQPSNSSFPIKTLCDKDYATTFCKIIYNYEPSEIIIEEETDEEDLFYNNLQIIVNEFSQEKLFLLDCDEEQAYSNQNCSFMVGNPSLISFVRSYEEDNHSYEIYSVSTSIYHDSPDEIKFYELDIDTKQVEDVTEMEEDRIQQKSAQEEQNAKKSIKAIKEYLNITEEGKFALAGQNPASYTFNDGSYMEFSSSIDDKYLVISYINSSLVQRFFNIELSSLKVTEITETEWVDSLSKIEY